MTSQYAGDGTTVEGTNLRVHSQWFGNPNVWIWINGRKVRPCKVSGSFTLIIVDMFDLFVYKSG